MKTGTDKWRRIYKSWEKSGLSRREFCRQNQLAISTFYYWQKKFKEANDDFQGTRDLIKLPIHSTKDKNVNFVLEFPGGYKLQIPQNSLSLARREMVSDLRDVLS